LALTIRHNLETVKSPCKAAQAGVRIIGIVVAVYLLAFVCLVAFQRQLIFVGADSAISEKPSVAQPHTWLHLGTSHGGGRSITALYVPAQVADGDPGPGATPTILYCYGNGGSIADSVKLVSAFSKLGCNVIVAEYPGYPLTPGVPTEAGCYAAADAEYDYLARHDPDMAKKLIVVGWSLGGAVAIDLASRRPCAGLVTLCAFTSMINVANARYPIYPKPLLRSILRYRFDNIDKIGRVRCPTLIIHGKRDLTVPLCMATELAAAAGGPVTRITLADASHADIFDADHHGARRALAYFIRAVTNRAEAPAGSTK